MTMAMMCIWEMRMEVCHRLVVMNVRMLRSWRDFESMFMLMVVIMCVFMLVLHFFVIVSMVVILSEMQPHTEAHEYPCN